MRSKIALLAFALPGIAGDARAQRLALATELPPEATMIARTEAGRGAAMPLVQERVEVVIDRQFARTEITQTYQNESDAAVEGHYRLRAGAGSVVEGFAYWNGEKKIVGEVFETETARQVYDQVVRRNRDPGLLEKVGDGVFAFKVFPIQPGEKKRVSVAYTAWLPRRGRRVELRAPVNSADADLVVRIRSSRPLRDIRSSTHAIEVDRGTDESVVRVGAPRGRVRPLVLSYDIDEPAWSLAAAVHKDAGSDGYFLLALAAPPVRERQVAAKDVTIVLDRSGSMAGLPIAQARQAAASVVKRLGPNDRVNVIAFDDEVDPLFAAPREANAATRARATAYIERLVEGGGTDIALALRTALAAQREGKRPRVVLFLTDGQSSAPEAVQAVNEDRRDVRVFTVGVGEAVNKPLLARLAAVKRGRFIHIRDAADLERDVSLMFRSISRPLLIGVSLDVDGASAHDIYPRSLPDLFVDDEILVSGRLTGTGPTAFALHGTLEGRPVTFRTRIDVKNGDRRSWVGKLWAESRVDHLSEKIALGEGSEEHRKEVVDLALAYNFVTDWTSFLAVPESELTAGARATLDGARARKQAILDARKDAVELDQPARLVDSGGDATGSDDDEPAESPRGEAMVIDRKHGSCAGCAAGGAGSGLATLLLLGVVIALGARRRRS